MPDPAIPPDAPASPIDGRYHVLGALGQGGMGAVYRVRDAVEGREVALKVVHAPGGVTPELRLRFREEFRAMSLLRHPNTIAVHDYGQIDGSAQYLTMALVPGEELADVVARGPLPITDALSLLAQLLQALGFIHSRLYLHRDVKAQNVRVARDGDGLRLTLMDFGLMCQLGLPIQAGRLSGSPGYLAPELLLGGVADAGTDLYAAGCLAYELLTGRLPFVGPLGQVVRAHAHEAPAPPTRLRPVIPAGVEAIVLKLMAKDQRQRYASAADALDDLAAVAGVAVTRASLDQRRSYLRSSVLVGREAEVAALTAAYRAAAGGAGRAVLLAAPAGVGKSRLVEEGALAAKLADAVVLAGRGDAGGLAPYEPVARALRPLLGRLAPGLRAALTPIFPELAGGHAPAVGSDEDRCRLHDAVAEALDAAGAPVVLAIEDLHDADAQTVALFNHLARGAAARRLLLVGTLRADEVPPGAPAWAAADEGVAEVIALAPLTAPQVEALVRSLLGEVALAPEMRDALVRASGGNPFFLTELLRLMLEGGALGHHDGAWRFHADPAALALPESVEATVLRRLAGLGEEAAALARVAAVAGRAPRLDALLAASGLPEDALFERLDELVARQFLMRTPDGHAFPHDRVREALAASLSAADRQAIHGRLADHLEAIAGPDPDDETVFELAHHAGHGPDPRRAHRWLARAGDRAEDRGAEFQAVQAWSAAAAALEAIGDPAAGPELRRLWRAIGVNAFALAPGVAIAPLEQLAAALEAEASATGHLEVRNERLLAYKLLAIAHAFNGWPTRSDAYIAQARALAPADDDGSFPALLHAYGYARHFVAGHYDALVASVDVVQARLDAWAGDVPSAWRQVAVSTGLQPLAVAFQGVRPAEAAVARAWRAAAGSDDPRPLLLSLLDALWFALTGRHDEAEPRLDVVLQAGRRLSLPPHPWLIYMRALMLWQRAEMEAARAMLDQALASPHVAAMAGPREMMTVLLGHVRLGLADPAGAEAAFAAALATARGQGLDHVAIKASSGLGRLARERGDLAGARLALGEALALAEAGPARNPLEEAIACRLLGQVAADAGDRVVARAMLARAMAIVTRPEQDNLLEQGLGHQALGEVHQAAGERTAAAAAFREAGERFHRLRNRHLLHGLNQRLGALLADAAPAGAPRAPADVAPEDRWMALRAFQMS